MGKQRKKTLTEEMRRLAAGIKFIDIRTDFGFKRVFGTPGNEDMTLMLVNAILPELHVKSLTLNNQENMGDRKDARKTVFDIRATTDKGETFDIEMQYQEQGDFNDRMLYYATFPIREQIGTGSLDFTLKPVYVISILNFTMRERQTTDSVINQFKLLNCADKNKSFTDSVSFYTVELPKFNKNESELSSFTEQMIWAIKNMGDLEHLPVNFSGDNFDKLFAICNFTAMTEDEQYKYLLKFHERLERNSELRTARNNAIKMGREEGLQQGLQEGLQQGLQEGIQQGRLAEKLEMAKNLKSEGIPFDTIIRCCGLSIEEIEAL